MRCLHCGKELALFKRLTGGGEFCSDAHRQKYQEEYNQLALSRLLQASPVAEGAEMGTGKIREAGAPVHEIESKVRQEVPVEVGYGSSGNGTNGSYHFEEEHMPEVAELVTHSISFDAEPQYLSETAISESSMEDEAPAGPSGFLVETFQPHFSLEPAIAIVEADFVWNEKPALPESEMVLALEARPGFAGVVSLETSLSIQDFRGNTRAPAVGEREMGRGVVNVNADFPEVVITGLEGTSRQMEVALKTWAPPDSPLFWEEPAIEFTEFHTQLGDLGRLAFVTLGWDEIAKGEGLAGQEAQARSVREPAPAEAAAAKPEAAEEVAVPQIEEIENEVVVVELSSAVEELSSADHVLADAREEAAVVETPEDQEEESVEETVPGPVTKPLPMTLHGHAPGRGKPVQVFPSAIARTAAIQIPRPNSLPLRPTMVFGPSAAPPAPAPVAAPVVAPVVTKEKTPVVPEPAKREAAAPPVVKKDPAAPVARPDIKTLIKPAVQIKRVEPEKKEPEKKESEKAPVIPAASAPAEKAKRDLPTLRKPEERKPEERKPEERKVEARKVEEPKVVERKPETREEPVRKEVPAPAAEPKAKKEPVVVAPIAAPAPSSPSYAEMDLGLPSLGMERSQQGFWSKLPVFAKASVGAALLVAIAGSYLYSTRHDAADSAAQKGPVVVAAGNVLSSGGAGWDTDWAPDPPTSKRQRRISLMHASQSLSDYRMELEGQIETKAMGWVFRASNPKNFYVEKIEIVKPGLQPKIQLVRFAVVDGVEQAHQEVPLTVPVRPDTIYKIRFEAIGDRFTTWLLDQKVDEWTDSRIASGGVGLYAEAGESLSMKGGLNVVPLVVKR